MVNHISFQRTAYWIHNVHWWNPFTVTSSVCEPSVIKRSRLVPVVYFYWLDTVVYPLVNVHCSGDTVRWLLSPVGSALWRLNLQLWRSPKENTHKGSSQVIDFENETVRLRLSWSDVASRWVRKESNWMFTLRDDKDQRKNPLWLSVCEPLMLSFSRSPTGTVYWTVNIAHSCIRNLNI